MKAAKYASTIHAGRLVIFLGLLDIGLELPATAMADEWTQQAPDTFTLMHHSASTEHRETTSTDEQSESNNKALSCIDVSIFYPNECQSEFGACWMGLKIDHNDNVYPINGNVYKLLPDGTLVNGVDDQDLFAYYGNMWAELDESGGNFYSPIWADIWVAPFTEGSTYSFLMSGLENGQAITLGRGPLGGSMFVTDFANQVSEVTLSPPEVSVFATGSDYFGAPEAITSAPDGTLYVVNLGFTPTRLTKITPAGVPSIFAIGTVPQVNRAIAVDDAGNVYWSQEHGIDKYDAEGNLLGTLPGPPDKSAFENPMGAAFDSKGDLYIVDNFDCKKIYKYTLTMPVTIDVKPASYSNSITPNTNGVAPVAVLTTNAFDATKIDPLSIRFGPDGATEAHDRGHVQDTDGDGDLDLVLHFRVQDTGIQCGDTSASMTGHTLDGQAIRGIDSIKTVSCSARRR